MLTALAVERGTQRIEDTRFQTPDLCFHWGAEMLHDIIQTEIQESSPAQDSHGGEGTDVADLAKREARWLLQASAVAPGRDPSFIQRPEMTMRVVSIYRSLVARRSKGEPLSYVIGEADFRGFDLFVTPDVLIPRSETEQLVELALLAAKKRNPSGPIRILDQGTGSGAIAIALAMELPNSSVKVVAVEISKSAVEIARRNVDRHGLSERVTVINGDLFPEAESEKGETVAKFDLIAANLPYISEDEKLPRNVADWEPKGALRAGNDGAELINRSLERAADFLTDKGIAIYEFGRWHSSWRGLTVMKDMAGTDRFLVVDRQDILKWKEGTDLG